MTLQHHLRTGGRSRNASPDAGRVACATGSAPMISRLLARVALVASLALSNAFLVHAQAPEVVFDLRIEKGRVAESMRLVRVKQGDAVRLRWTTDRPIVLHLHGYDIETKVMPGSVAEMAFTARVTGRFPVEEHTADARGSHSHGEAPLVRLEVRPR